MSLTIERRVPMISVLLCVTALQLPLAGEALAREKAPDAGRRPAVWLRL